MILFRAMVFNIALYLWTFFMGLGGMPMLALPLRFGIRAARFWARGVLVLLRWIVGLDHRVVGIEKLPDGASVIASKHQSAWDTIVFLALLPSPVYVLKQELMWIPIYGWYAKRIGMIPVDRSAGASALKKLIADARPILAAGRSIVIFPQGTRTPVGSKLPYLPGVYSILAAAPGVPVVPVALNSGKFWGRRAILKRPGVITLQFLDPMPHGLDRRSFMAQLESRIEAATADLEKRD